MKNNKALSLIGLATKAGKTVSGEFSTEKSIKTGKGYLAIVAGDSSDNTKKKFRNMCEFYEVPLYILSDKETLGHDTNSKTHLTNHCFGIRRGKNLSEVVKATRRNTNPHSHISIFYKRTLPFSTHGYKRLIERKRYIVVTAG